MRATYADALEIVGVRHVHRLRLARVDGKTGHLVAHLERILGCLAGFQAKLAI